MALKYKVLISHKRGCTAMRATLRGDWTTPWAYFEWREHRDTLGRRTRHGAPWWRARCNDMDCPAEIAINETSIFETLPT